MSATTLLELHRAPEILTLVDVWDVASARAVAAAPDTRALATASHSIAAVLGHEDGEHIPVGEMLDMVGRIVAAVDLPVTADLEGGYGDAAETVRRAIGLGVVGANIEDQLKPLDEAAAQVAAVMAAAEREGVPDFVLNARTDVLLRAGDRPVAELLPEVIERGRAYLDAGAPVVFVPGAVDEDAVTAMVDAFGPRRLTLIGFPGNPPPARLQELGVARVSYGPSPHWVALTALRDLVDTIARGADLPEVRVRT